MAQYTLFKLHFSTPLHIGLGRSSYDSSASDLHSDTLSAALASIKAQHGANSQEIKTFLDSFVLSSAFPFEGERYFLPLPLNIDRILIDGNDDVNYRKKLKSIRFVESSVWKEFLSAGMPSISGTQIQDEFVTSINDKDFVAPYKKQVVQRVAVSRSGEQASSPFFFEWCFFDKLHNAGLYVIADASREVVEELEILFQELGEVGIGTDKTVGGGQFEVSTDSIELPSGQADNWISLSLYIPSSDEWPKLKMDSSYYNIQKRGGYLAGSSAAPFRHLWKKSVYMLEEGSVLNAEVLPRGQIVDLRPDWNDAELHPVYRSGKSLFIPINLKNA